MTFRGWQQDLRLLLLQRDCPPVIVVELPKSAGKTTVAEDLYDGFDRDAILWSVPDATELIVGDFPLTLIDNITVENGKAVARAALGVARSSLRPQSTVVFFGEDCSEVTKVIGEIPGLRSAYIRDFSNEMEAMRNSFGLALQGWRIPYMIFENGV